jgi:hypothetical protein
MTTAAQNLAYRMVQLRESHRFEPALLDRFARWVAEAPEEELFRVNPLKFAAEQKLSRRDAVDLFVHSARAGIFDFAWGVVCRDCGAFITTRGGLRSLGRDKKTCKL